MSAATPARQIKVLPLEPPPLVNCLVSGFTVAHQLVELLVARSGHHELHVHWHPGGDQLPILSSCVLLSALFGFVGFITSLYCGLPRLFRSRSDHLANFLSCLPIVLISLMVHFSGRAQRWNPDSSSNSDEVAFSELLEDRFCLFLVACGLLLIPSIEFKVRTGHIPYGLRTSSGNGTLEAQPEGVPNGLELFEIVAPPIVETSVEAVLMGFYLVDVSLGLCGNDTLVRTFISVLGPSMSSLKGGFLILLAVVGAFRLREALVQPSKEHWCLSSLPLLSAIFSLSLLSSEISFRLAVLQAALQFACMANAAVQISLECGDIKHLAVEAPPCDKKTD